MTISNEQIQAIKAADVKPVGKFMLVMGRWHHIWHGEGQYTKPRMPMVKLYSEEAILSLLAEREADKALIAEQAKRIAELEARTLTVKLPEPLSWRPPSRRAVVLLSEVEEVLAAAGITLVVGGE